MKTSFKQSCFITSETSSPFSFTFGGLVKVIRIRALTSISRYSWLSSASKILSHSTFACLALIWLKVKAPFSDSVVVFIPKIGIDQSGIKEDVFK
jgi:hypothetical protein